MAHQPAAVRVGRLERHRGLGHQRRLPVAAHQVGVATQVADPRRADAEHRETQLLEDHRDGLLERLVARRGGAHQRPGDPDGVGAERQRLGDVDAVAHTAAGDQHAPGAALRARISASVVGMPQPAKDAATRARTGSLMRWRSTSLHDVPAGAGDVDRGNPGIEESRDQVVGDAPADLLDDHRCTEVPRTRAAMRASSPPNAVLPDGCSASCSGFRCSTRASARSACEAGDGIRRCRRRG